MLRSLKVPFFFTAVALALAVTSSAQASVVTASSYSMLNGDGQDHQGTYNYWDKSYNGSGSVTTDESALSGGTGDLTDGVIATDNWFNTENVAGTGPYVGWKGFDPTIDFFFAALHSFTDVTFYFDDSNGAGGVDQPSQVTINSTLLHKAFDGGDVPAAGQTYPTTFVTGIPRAVKPFRTATRTWNSAT